MLTAKYQLNEVNSISLKASRLSIGGASMVFYGSGEAGHAKEKYLPLAKLFGNIKLSARTIKFSIVYRKLSILK